MTDSEKLLDLQEEAFALESRLLEFREDLLRCRRELGASTAPRNGINGLVVHLAGSASSIHESALDLNALIGEAVSRERRI